MSAADCDCGPGDFTLIHLDSTTIQIALAWQPVIGAAGYTLERADSCVEIGTGSAAQYELGPTNAYGDTGFQPNDKFRFHAKPTEVCAESPGLGCPGLSASQTYYYRVHVTGTGQVSNCIGAQLATGPPAERNLAGPAGDGSGDLWADIVIGQADFAQNVFRKTQQSSYEWASGVLIDKWQAPNRMFIADANHNRVLGFDHLGSCDDTGDDCTSDSDCAAGTCTLAALPDIVLGQSSFFDQSACNGDGTGQVFPYRAMASASSLCLIDPTQISIAETVASNQMDTDADGAFYFPDTFNNRVLKYDDPFSTDAVADEVVGQADFTGTDCNACQGAGCAKIPSDHNLCTSGGGGSAVALDAQGNLWVTDSGNFRVLRFPVLGDGTLSAVADVVLGQLDFSSRTEPSGSLSRGADRIKYANDVTVDHATGVVYVADAGSSVSPPSSRILVFAPDGGGNFQNGMAATQVLAPSPGECSGNAQPCWSDTDCSGGQCDFDPTDPFNFRPQVLELVKIGASTDGLLMLGRSPFKPEYTTRLVDLATAAIVYETTDIQGSGADLDVDGNLFVLSRWDDNLGRYEASDLGLPNPPREVVFAGAHHQVAVSPDSMLGGKGTALLGDQLIVADNHRLLIWNGHDPADLWGLSPTGVNARLPDDVYGEVDFQTMSFSNWFAFPQVHDGQLWVHERTNGDRIQIFAAPFRGSLWPVPAERSTPVATIQLTSGGGFDGFPVLGDSGGRKICVQVADEIDFAVTASGDALWIADRWRSRIFRIVDWNTVAPYVDVVIGHPGLICDPCNLDLCNPPGTLDPAIDHCNKGAEPSVFADALCFPYNLALDAAGNLYVADNGGETGSNQRLLEYDASVFPDPLPGGQALFGLEPSRVFGTGGDPNTKGWAPGIDPMISPFKPAFHPDGYMVVGNNPYSTQRFPVVYLDPLREQLPQFILGDFTSYPVGTYLFDPSGNLYLNDSDYSRVLVYKDPFAQLSFPPGPTAAPTTSPTATPTAVPCSFGTYSAEVLADSPVGYWRLGESSGATAVNEVGPNGTYVGSYALGAAGVPNDADTAVDLSGGFVNGGNDASIDIIRPLTLEAWIKPTSLPTQNMRIIAKEDGFNRANYGLDLTGPNQVRYYIAYGTNYEVVAWSYAFAVGTWYHLVVTHAGDDRVRLWVNGQELASTVVTHVAQKATTPLGIGSTHGAGAVATFPGIIDEAAIYDSPLTNARVQAHYFAGACAAFTPTPTLTSPPTVTPTASAISTASATSTPTGTACGNAVLDSGEACDDGVANGTASSCCAASCQYKPNGPASCDGNSCTRSDTCTNGVCSPGSCAIGAACTICGGICGSAGGTCGCGL